jgi:O-antigen/teichoic acid export membrane protein
VTPNGVDVGVGVASDRISRNAAFSLASKLGTAAMTGALMLFLGRRLGPTEYGYFALAVSIGGVVMVLSDLGLSASAARFVAERRSDRSAVRAVMADALRLKVVASTAVSLVLFAAATPIVAAFDAPAAAWTLRWIAVGLFGQSVMLLILRTFEALGRIPLNLRIVYSESVLEITSSVALVVVIGGATSAALGRAIGYTLGGAIAIVVLVRLLGRSRFKHERPIEIGWREILRYAGALLLIDGVFRLFSEVDVLLIAALLPGSASVGLFSLPMQLAWFFHWPVGAVAAAVAPRLARERQSGPNVEAFMTTLRYIIVVQGVFIAPIVVWAGPIIDLLLGTGYAESADVLRALAPFVFLAGPAVLLGLGVNFLGEARRRVPLVIAVLLANVAVDVVLLPQIGIVAGAIGTDVAYAIWVPAHLLIIRRLLDVPLGPLMLTVVRAMLGAAAMAGVLLLIGTEHPAIPLFLAGGAAGVLVYVVVLVLSRELSRADLVFLRALPARRDREPS